MRLISTALVLSAAFAVAAFASDVNASRNDQSLAGAPAGRDFAAMAYNAAAGTVLLFGGTDPLGHVLADTWTWDGAAWARQTPSVSPPARGHASMTYDAVRSVIVLFGGQTGMAGPSGSRNLDDIWTWNGSNWMEQSPSRRPPAQADAAMTFDRARGAVLLFSTDGATWIWDGQDWSQQQPGLNPPARVRAVLAFDAVREVPILFGGLNSSGYLSDTWTWDGTNWTQATPALSPPGRDFAAMAFDAAGGSVLLFGGFRVDAAPFPHPVDFNDTWSWDGFTWRQLAPPTDPPPLTGAVMTYDEVTKEAVLFGRHSNLAAEAPNDLWTWDGATWTRRFP